MPTNNTRTEKANIQRCKNADEFALSVIEKLNDIENETGYCFKSLRDRCVALNHLGITPLRGGKWTKTQMSRTLKRVCVLTTPKQYIK